MKSFKRLPQSLLGLTLRAGSIGNKLELEKAASSLFLTGRFRALFENGAYFINAVGGLLLLFSSLSAIMNTVHLIILKLLKKKNGHFITGGRANLDTIRMNLGEMITYALELLVAADVIDTLTKPAHEYKIETLYKIGAVVVIRTTLAYFLGKELEDLEERVEKKRSINAHPNLMMEY